MADKHLIELGRRAVACKGWRWLPGMRTLAQSVCLDGRRFVDSKYPGVPFEVRHGFGLPDLRDPCTRGGLLALVREAWDCPSLTCGHEGGWDDDWNTWTVSNPPGKGRGCKIASCGCASEAEALLAALEAAP